MGSIIVKHTLVNLGACGRRNRDRLVRAEGVEYMNVVAPPDRFQAPRQILLLIAG